MSDSDGVLMNGNNNRRKVLKKKKRKVVRPVDSESDSSGDDLKSNKLDIDQSTINIPPPQDHKNKEYIKDNSINDLNNSKSRISNKNSSDSDKSDSDSAINQSKSQRTNKSDSDSGTNQSKSQPTNKSDSDSGTNLSKSQRTNKSDSDSGTNQSKSQRTNKSDSDSGTNLSKSQRTNKSDSDSGTNQSKSQRTNKSDSDSGTNQSKSQRTNKSDSDSGTNQSKSQRTNKSDSDSGTNLSKSQRTNKSDSDSGTNQSKSQRTNKSDSDSGTNQSKSQRSNKNNSDSESNQIKSQRSDVSDSDISSNRTQSQRSKKNGSSGIVKVSQQSDQCGNNSHKKNHALEDSDSDAIISSKARVKKKRKILEINSDSDVEDDGGLTLKEGITNELDESDLEKDARSSGSEDLSQQKKGKKSKRRIIRKKDTESEKKVEKIETEEIKSILPYWEKFSESSEEDLPVPSYVESPKPQEKSKNRKQKPMPEKKSVSKKAAKAAAMEMDKIRSEHMAKERNAKIKLPYHVPQQRTLEEFLSRKKSFPNNALLSLRMSGENLKTKLKQVQLEKNTTLLPQVKSSDLQNHISEPSLPLTDLTNSSDLCAKHGAMDEETVPVAVKSAHVSDLSDDMSNINHDVQEITKPETVSSSEILNHNVNLNEDNKDEQKSPCIISDEAHSVTNHYKLFQEMTRPVTPVISEILHLDDDDVNLTVDGKKENTVKLESICDKLSVDTNCGLQSKASLPSGLNDGDESSDGSLCLQLSDSDEDRAVNKSDENKHKTSEKDDVQQSLNNIDTKNSDNSLQVEMNLVKDTGKEELGASTEPVKISLFGEEYSSCSDDDVKEVKTPEVTSTERLAMLRRRGLVGVGNICPRLSGGGVNDVIDLDADGESKQSGVIDLLQRFLKHNAKRKPSPKKKVVELSVVSAEKDSDGMEQVKKELVKVLLDQDEDSRDPVPGAKLRRLKQTLQQQMALRRSAEWHRKMEEKKLDEEEMDDDEKATCAMLDNEDEMTESEVDEEEEEEEEDDIPLVDKKHTTSAFCDDEAEVSEVDEEDGGDNDMQEGGEDVEEEEDDDDEEDMSETGRDDTNDSVSQADITPTLKGKESKSRFQRLKTFDIFDSDEEGDTLTSDKLSETNADDTFLPSSMLPAGQVVPPSPIIATQLTPSQVSPLESLVDNENKFPNTQDYFDEVNSSSTQVSVPRIAGIDKLIGRSNTESTDEDLFGICSGRFPTRPFTSALQCDEDDLAAMCSGRFESQARMSQLDSQVDVPLSQTQPSQTQPSQTQPSQTQQLQQNFSDALSSRIADLPPAVATQERIIECASAPAKLTPNTQETATNRWTGFEMASSDDEADNLFPDEGKVLTKKKKLRKKLEFSDDEDESNNDDTDEDVEEEGDREIEYDSEENEVKTPIRVATAGGEKKSSRAAKEFFENEAELSESEWGSEDEDERGLDKLEYQEADEEQFDTDAVKEQLGKIHMRQVLDADQREVRMLQEMLFDDGELHAEGGGRERQFRWRNVDADDTNEGPLNDSGDEDGADDGEGEEEERWRIMRHEREVFLREQKAKAEAEGKVDDGILADEDSQLLKLGKAALKRIRSIHSQEQITLERSRISIKKTISEPLLSPNVKCPLVKRGSFLARGEGALARIAAMTRDSTGNVVLNNAKNSRNFVFTTISPKEEVVDEPVKKVEKRKAAAITPSQVKKTKLSEDRTKGRRLFDHLV